MARQRETERSGGRVPREYVGQMDEQTLNPAYKEKKRQLRLHFHLQKETNQATETWLNELSGV